MPGSTFKPALLARLFLSSGEWREARVASEGLWLRTRRSTRTTPFSEIKCIRRHRSLLFGKLEFTTLADERVILGGLTRSGVNELASELSGALECYARTYILEHESQIRSTRKAIVTALSAKRYVSSSVAKKLLEACDRYSFLLEGDFPDEVLGNARGDLRIISAFVKEPGRLRTETNARFLSDEAYACASLFDQIESSPLTHQQRRAVLTAEDNTLVVAGAGSGKTSVIVAKIAYQLHRELIQADEVLALAFSREAKDELEQRFKRRLGKSIEASTFHALGLRIISETASRKPDVSVLATDQAKLLKFVQDTIERAFLEDGALRRKLDRWLSIYFAPYKPASAFADKVDYWEYLRNQGLRSLSGDLVKSYEECEIADYLYINGIPFEYEAPYEHETASVDRRQYKPDFKIGPSGIYVEHFAINKEGRTPPFIDHEEYTTSMEWKRRTHEEYGTCLIETYSWQHKDGTLLTSLGDALRTEGFEFRPISPDVELARLKKLGRVSRLASLATSFLNHQKSGRVDRATLIDRAKATVDHARNLAFLDVCQIVSDAYRDALASSHEIDFNDMINDAADAVTEGKFKSPWRLILVDEFQDISQSRARLIKALLDQDGPRQLYVVGDDWQAIYRFAGADVAIMRNFESIFGAEATVELNDTFRFGESLAKVSADFVRANPAQTQRSIRSTKETRPAVVVIQQSEEGKSPLGTALAAIRDQLGDEQCIVLVLGRYRHSRPSDLDYWQEEFPTIDIKFRTVHASKGLEADFVIVVDMVNGRLGFPSEILDDPVLDLVLTEEDHFSNAEERRLFYVALTRARRTVYLLTDTNESAFIQELKSADGVHLLEGERGIAPSCPSCKRGRLVPREGKFGSFLGCSYFPYCRFTDDA